MRILRAVVTDSDELDVEDYMAAGHRVIQAAGLRWNENKHSDRPNGPN